MWGDSVPEESIPGHSVPGVPVDVCLSGAWCSLPPPRDRIPGGTGGRHCV